MNDCDYRHKLNPEEAAWYDQFIRETVLNRWYDKQGVEPFYPAGSEGRRKLQFQYNRRFDDIMTHKEWVRFDRVQEGDNAVDHHSLAAKIAPLTVIPASTPTEDDIIEAIDRSRE